MEKPAISVVDYGVGNLSSVVNMIRKAGHQASLVRSPDEISAALRLVLPGVGSFDSCRRALDRVSGAEPALREAISRGVPLLGICVGMQLLASSSEEGTLPGLAVVPGRVRRFELSAVPGAERLRVPHMAWSVVRPVGEATLFRDDLGAVNRFYFVHSYHFVCDDAKDIAATARHGIEFTAAVQRGHVYGVQFHPEKSHRFGLELLRRFATLPVGSGHA